MPDAATADLFAAVEAHDLSRATAALRQGADADGVEAGFLKRRPLHAAVVACEDGGPIEMLELLLQHGAGINATYDGLGGGTPLLCALFNGLDAPARLLLVAGADPNAAGAEGDTPLRWSVEQGDHAWATLLLSMGADRTIDAFGGWEGRTALGMTVRRLDARMVELLLSAGADPGAADLDHKTAVDSLPEFNDANRAAWMKVRELLQRGGKASSFS